MPFQQGLLATPVPAHARHLFFTLQSPEALPAALDACCRRSMATA
jgi:putative iron-dependent peroxidase